MTFDYYQQKLSAEKLLRVYDIAPPRVKQYLQAEIDFMLDRLRSTDTVLEMGCGYGRILGPLAEKAGLVYGIDTSLASLKIARRLSAKSIRLACMDAVDLGFADRFFDCVICIQNGISVFHVEPARLVRESIRIAKDGGRIFFSSYSEKFWEHRLEWFEMQSEQGLLGEIDRSATGNGRIVCRDGFTATTFSANDFDALLMDFSVRYSIHEVDQSSIFCEIKV